MPADPASSHAAAEAALTDADLAAIKNAILIAYPERPELYNLLLDKWGVRVGDVIYVEQAGALVIAALIDWAKGQGRTLEMLSLAWTEKHRQHSSLQKLAERFFSAPEDEVRKYAEGDALAATATGKLSVTDAVEAIVLPAAPRSKLIDAPPPMIDFRLLARLEAATCLVEIGESVRATGFLIGRQSVLTVYHAAAEALKEEWGGDRIRVHFAVAGGSATVKLSAAPDLAWRGPFSRYAASDLTGRGAPAANRLDFALIRLAEPVDAARAVLDLPREVPIVAPGDALLIAQHAMGGPLQLATGTLLGYSSEGERLHYETNTAPGSAGSPVLGRDNKLIAIHHAAHMVGDKRVAQGVPIWPIRQAILAAGMRLEDF